MNFSNRDEKLAYELSVTPRSHDDRLGDLENQIRILEKQVADLVALRGGVTVALNVNDEKGG